LLKQEVEYQSIDFAEETGSIPAPKEQPPRKLSGKRTARSETIWREAPFVPTEGASAMRFATADETLRYRDRWGA